MKNSSSLLNGRLNSRFASRKSNRKKIYSGIFVLLLLPYLGTTLAATVTISGNSGTNSAIEFGQGSQVSIVCDTSITTEVNESWYGTSSVFRVDSIELSGINVATDLTATTNNQGCGGKNMTVRLFTGTGGSTAAAVIGSGSTSAVTFLVPTSGTSVTVSGSTGITGTASIASSEGTITLTLPSAINLDASTVTRVAIETD